jgi:hypothetical protein
MIRRRFGQLCLGSILLWSSVATAGDSTETDVRTRGQANAPLTLIEYSDFTCGYCLKFFKDTWPRIQARYVDTGKVRFVYRDYPRADRGPGVDAAMAARCAGAQGQYWAMHDRLFSEGGQLDKQVYNRHAKTLGLDRTPVRSSKIVRKPISGAFTEHQGLFSYARPLRRRSTNPLLRYPEHFRSRCFRMKSSDFWQAPKSKQRRCRLPVLRECC